MGSVKKYVLVCSSQDVVRKKFVRFVSHEVMNENLRAKKYSLNLVCVSGGCVGEVEFLCRITKGE